jgi:VanZ family protein
MNHFRFWKPLIISVIILILCLIPSTEIQKLDILEFSYTDLLAHFTMFTVFSAVLFKDLLRYSGRSTKRTLLLTALSINCILGFSTEALQYLMAFLNRSASISDFLFDCLGSVLGIIIVSKTTGRKPGPGF